VPSWGYGGGVPRGARAKAAGLSTEHCWALCTEQDAPSTEARHRAANYVPHIALDHANDHQCCACSHHCSRRVRCIHRVLRMAVATVRRRRVRLAAASLRGPVFLGYRRHVCAAQRPHRPPGGGLPGWGCHRARWGERSLVGQVQSLPNAPRHRVLIGNMTDAGHPRQPGAVDEPAQHQHRLPIAAQRSTPPPGTASALLSDKRAGHEQHGLLGDRKHGGVGDRIRHSRTSVRLDICGRTSLLPRSCTPSDHLAALGVSRTCQSPATGNGSLPAA
jgi:hypothetical protein